MRILYLTTTASAAMSGTDALHNTVDLLSKTFASETINLYPFRTPSSRYPRMLYGIHKMQTLVRLARHCDVVHIFSPTATWYPVLRKLTSKPLILSVVATVGPKIDLESLSRYEQILVSVPRHKQELNALGTKVKVVIPGIDTSHIVPHQSHPSSEIHLLMASAPWTLKQFHSKGIMLICKAMQTCKQVRMTFLWRGILHEELIEAIENQPQHVQDRIRIINRKIDLNTIYPEVDAGILLAETPDLVKAHPHSLVECLAAGKPVILSSTIGMSDYVHQHEVGWVLEDFKIDPLQKLFSILLDQYSSKENNVKKSRASEFSTSTMIGQLREIYQAFLDAR
ncbi:MAG: glycosyltransferase [Saprospiraceae bacterium]|nr:glycosyltransferase [Saprospiraceae bacterium]